MRRGHDPRAEAKREQLKKRRDGRIGLDMPMIMVEKNTPEGPMITMPAIEINKPIPIKNLDKEVDTLQKQIEGNVPKGQKEALQEILKLAAARFHFNQVLRDFFVKSNKEQIIEYLRGEMEEADIDEEVIQSAIYMAEHAPDDQQAYEAILHVIKKDYKSKNIFEHLFEKLRFTISDNRFQEKNNEETTKKLPKNIQKFMETPFYQEGRELPHQEEIQRLAEPFLSAQFLAYIKYYTIEEKIHKASARIGQVIQENYSKNRFYFEKITGKYNTYLDETQKKMETIDEKLKSHPLWLDLKQVYEDFAGIKQLLSKTKLAPGILLETTKREEFYKLYSIQDSIEKSHKQWKTAYKKLEKAVARASAPLPPALMPASEVVASSSLAPVSASASASAATFATATAFVSASLSASAPASATASSSASTSMSASAFESAFASISAAAPPVAPNKPIDEEKPSQDLIFSRPRRLSLLGAANQKILNAIFSDDLMHNELTFSEISNLIIALGGKIIQQAGSRVRFALKERIGDVLVSTQSLHGAHGQDKRNDTLSKLTVQFIRSLIGRAGYEPEALKALEAEEAAKLAKKKPGVPKVKAAS